MPGIKKEAEVTIPNSNNGAGTNGMIVAVRKSPAAVT